MIVFNSNIDMRLFKKNNYKISKSSKVYTYFKNEYRYLNENEYDHILMQKNKKRKMIYELLKDIIREDTSIKIPIGSEQHMYFATEYNHTLLEDREHSIIVPEDNNHMKKR